MNDAPIIKDFSLQDQNDEIWQLSTALQAGPVALISYRGKWCPFCIKTWLGLKKTQQDFARLGVQLVGLSVESPVSPLGQQSRFYLIPEQIVWRQFYLQQRA